MRAVLDTNVLISGLLWRGAPHECLLAAEAELYTLVSAEPILDELRNKLIVKFLNTPQEAEDTIAGLRRVSTLVQLVGKGGWVAADPDDDKFVETALVGGADAIVSGDRHQLKSDESSSTETKGSQQVSLAPFSRCLPALIVVDTSLQQGNPIYVWAHPAENVEIDKALRISLRVSLDLFECLVEDFLRRGPPRSFRRRRDEAIQ